MKKALLLIISLNLLIVFIAPELNANDLVPKTITVKVPANKKWTKTGIFLQPGAVGEIVATGSVRAGGAVRTLSNPSGMSDVPPEGTGKYFSNLPQPAFPASSLIGQEEGGQVFLIGQKFSFKWSDVDYGKNELWIGINDDDVSDNSGEWEVKVTVADAKMLKINRFRDPIEEAKKFSMKDLSKDFNPPGRIWRGRVLSEPYQDFTLLDPVPSSTLSGEKLVRYRAINITPEIMRLLIKKYGGTDPTVQKMLSSEWSWTIDMEIFNKHFLAIKKAWTPIGQFNAASYEGTISPEGNYASGVLTYLHTEKGKDVANERVRWWATLEDDLSPAPSDKIDLNSASVGGLESIGLSPISARTIVHGRVVWGHFKSAAEALKAPGLTEKEQEILKERAYVN